MSIICNMSFTPLTGPNALNIMRHKLGIDSEKLKNAKTVETKKSSSVKDTSVKKRIKEKKNETETDNFIDILTIYSKLQNIDFLHEIIKFKKLSNEESDLFIKKYLKLSYYTPNLIK